MPEIPDVTPGDETEALWANLIRSRTMMRYTNQAALDAGEPSPDPGRIAYVIDEAVAKLYTGTEWAPVAAVVALMGNGTVDEPSHSFESDPDTGMYRQGADQIAFTAGGTKAFFIGGGGYVATGGDAGSAVIRTLPGSQAQPVYTFEGDLDTGIWRTANRMHFGVGNADFLRLWNSGGTLVVESSAIYDLTTGSAANLHISSSTQLRRSTALAVLAEPVETATLDARLTSAGVAANADGDDELNVVAVLSELLDRIEALEAAIP